MVAAVGRTPPADEFRNLSKTLTNVGTHQAWTWFDPRMQRFLKNYRVSVPVAFVLLTALSLLAFGYFGVHKLWIDERVDEAAPTLDGAPTVFASGEFVSRDHPTSGTAEVLSLIHISEPTRPY